MNYISLGGWCGTKLALEQNGLFNEASLPFDDVRSKFEGVIRNIEEDFENFLTYNKQIGNLVFIGKDLSFFHHDLTNKEVIESFGRKIDRFKDKIINTNNLCFIRTVAVNDYDLELKLYDKFKKIIKEKYNRDDFYFAFVISSVDKTEIWKALDSRCYVFSVMDVDINKQKMSTDQSGLSKLGDVYKPVFNFMNNLLIKKHKKTFLSNIYFGYEFFK
jgi:hypothetical protein